MPYREPRNVPVTIAVGQTESDAFEVSHFSFLSIHCPATVAGTSFTAKVAPEKGGTYQTVQYSLGGTLTNWTFSLAASKTIAIDEGGGIFASLGGWMKIVSDAAASGADEVYTMMLKA